MAVQVFAYDFRPELPPGTRIEGIYPHGASYWTRTAAIKTSQADDRKQTPTVTAKNSFTRLKSLNTSLRRFRIMNRVEI